MTAVNYGYDEAGSAHDPLAPGAPAEVVREHLLPEDRPQFDLELREATDRAAREDRVDHWRHVAVIQSDYEGFVAMVRRAAERNTGRPISPEESLEETRAKAGM